MLVARSLIQPKKEAGPQLRLAPKKPVTRFDHLVASGLIAQAELEQTLREASEKSTQVESLLIEKYKISKREIGQSLSLFYKCSFMEFDNRTVIPSELIKNISLQYLRANYWVPLRLDGNKLEVLIDDPYSFQKIQDIKRLFRPGRLNSMSGCGKTS